MTKLSQYIFASILSFSFVCSANAEDVQELFPQQKSCVAYRTEKTFMFIRTVTVVGKNCDMSAEVIPEPGNKFHVEMSVPIAGFESGELERDRDVAKLLKADVSKNLSFISESIPVGVWKEKLAEGHFSIAGKLFIGKKPYPLTIEIDRQETKEGNDVFVGISKSRFKAFGIDPPALFAGFGARVSSKLDLIFQLRAHEVLGSQSLLRK